jgi:hypothetical protein
MYKQRLAVSICVEKSHKRESVGRVLSTLMIESIFLISSLLEELFHPGATGSYRSEVLMQQ